MFTVGVSDKGSDLKALLGLTHFQAHGVNGRIRFLVDGWTEDLSSLPSGLFNMAACFIKASKGATILSSLIMAVISHNLCSILWVRSKSLGPADMQEERINYTGAWGSLRSHRRVCLPHSHNSVRTKEIQSKNGLKICACT